MDEDTRIDRCDCIGVRFAELLRHGNLPQAQAATDCGVECGGCLPYLRLMFETGETDFDIDDPRLS